MNDQQGVIGMEVLHLLCDRGHHEFENRGSVRAGVLNLSMPGEFEPHMPDIVQWFSENPPKNANGR